MDKPQVEALAKQYAKLETGFKGILLSFERICKDGFLGFKDDDGVSEHSMISGFGRTMFFSWKFVIHKGKSFGIFSVYDENDSPPFYNIYFRGAIPCFIRVPEQDTVEFYGNHLMDMETLLSEIIGAFLEQDYFKP